MYVLHLLPYPTRRALLLPLFLSRLLSPRLEPHQVYDTDPF